MEQLGEENKQPFYTRTFYEIDEQTSMGIEKWLNDNSSRNKGWRSNFIGRYYYQMGYEQSSVGVMGDLIIEIFDPSIAFKFEMFKIGGRSRYNIPSGYDPYSDKFDSVEEDFID